MVTVHNPVLRGFNPDPSIVRVGDDFYIATSSFEWYPGVRVWHSRDVASWRLVARPLAETRLLDMTGFQSSGGVWAPCLSWNDGTFYLVYSTVRGWRGAEGRDRGAFKDTPNFLTTAPTIEGPWSDPVFLTSSGFDASLFHGDNGRSWCVNMEWDYRGTRTSPSHFSGILLQEFDRERGQLVGPIRKIFTPTRIESTEAPHLYKRNGWYYLVTAEGGTSYAHAVTVARSRAITGPYELHPNKPFLSAFLDYHRDVRILETAVGDSDGLGYPLRDTGATRRLPVGFFERPQKAGHGSLCPVSGDEWVLAHLSGRPVPGTTACPLGRETSLARVRWYDDDWPYVVDNDGTPIQHSLASVVFTGVTGASEGLPGVVGEGGPIELHPTEPIHPAFRGLRRPWGGDVTRNGRSGSVRLVGRESPASTFVQTVMATAVTDWSYVAETRIEFEPESFQQMAGLIVRYDERNQYYLRVTVTYGKRTLGIVVYTAGSLALPVQPEAELAPGPVRLAIVVRRAVGRFFRLEEDVAFDWFAGIDPARWTPGGSGGHTVHAVGPPLDMLQLSDERTWPMGFTGTFTGVACHDMTGRAIHADVISFCYRPLP